jgi:hypothetical protein
LFKTILTLEALCKDFPTFKVDVAHHVSDRDKKICFAVICLLCLLSSVLIFTYLSDYTVFSSISGAIICSAPIFLYLQSVNRKHRKYLFNGAALAREQWLNDKAFNRSLIDPFLPAKFYLEMFLEGILILGGTALVVNLIVYLASGFQVYLQAFLGCMIGNIPALALNYYKYRIALDNERVLSKL